MQLSNEQRELLSAYLDGEVNASEKALALGLLEREEARAYIAGLERLRALAQTHAGARAPRDLVSLVRQSLDGDFDSISRPTSNQGDYDSISRPTSNQLQLNAMPQASWRMPLMAMAAAVVMAVGIFAVNSLMIPGDARPELSTAGREFRKDPEAAPRAGAEPQPELQDRAPSPPAADMARVAKKPEHSDANEKYERKNSTRSPSDAQDAPGEDLKKGYADEERKKDAGTKDDDKNSVPEKSDGWSEGGATGGVAGGGAGGGERKDLEGKEPRRSGKRSQSDAGPAESPKAPAPENRPSDSGPAKEAAKAKEPVHEVTIDVTGARTADAPTLTTDMLEVASAYGQATADSSETGATIEVEVAEDQLDEMLAALNKVAKSAHEKKANARGEADEPPSNDQANDEPSRARDYLPKDKREATKETPESGTESEGEKVNKPAAPAQIPKKKVRIVVRLK